MTAQDEVFEEWWPNKWVFGNMITSDEEDKEYERTHKEVAKQAFDKGVEYGAGIYRSRHRDTSN